MNRTLVAVCLATITALAAAIVVGRAAEPLRPQRSRRAAHDAGGVVRAARSGVESRRPLDRVLDARRHLEGPGRRRRSDRGHVRAGVSLRAGVEPGRHDASRSRYQSTGNLEIGIVSADGGPEQTIASHPRVDIQPAWSRDGKSLFFVSARAGGWRIFRHDFATEDRHARSRNGIQPAVSPDGKLARVRAGRPARARPRDRANRGSSATRRPSTAWSRRGRRTARTSSTSRKTKARTTSASCPAAGGDPIELTIDTDAPRDVAGREPGRHAVRVRAVRGGVPTLYTADITGGRASAWRKVPITRAAASRRPAACAFACSGRTASRCRARIYIDASDGGTTRRTALFHRSMMVFDRHYFHTDGEAELEVPAGRGHDRGACAAGSSSPTAVTVDVPAGGDADRRRSGSSGWPICRRAAGTRATATCTICIRASARRTSRSSGSSSRRTCNVTHALIHMDGTRLMGRWSDLTGKPSPLSTQTHILQYAQEFRGGLGPHRDDRRCASSSCRSSPAPAARRTRSRRSSTSISRARARRAASPASCIRITSAPRTPANAAATLIALDLALGLGDYYDIGALYSDERGSADFYYRLLNAGFRIAATGGTDNFSDVWLDPPPGSRSHVCAPVGPADAARTGSTRSSAAGRIFSSGPLLFASRSRARSPATRSRSPPAPPASLRVVADVVSIAPLESLEILVNGEVAQTVRATDPLHVDLRRPHRGARTAAGSRCAPAGRSRSTSATTTRSRRRRRSTSCAAVAGI